MLKIPFKAKSIENIHSAYCKFLLFKAKIDSAINYANTDKNN